MCLDVSARFGKVLGVGTWVLLVCKSDPIGIILTWFGSKLAHGKGPGYLSQLWGFDNRKLGMQTGYGPHFRKILSSDYRRIFINSWLQPILPQSPFLILSYLI